MEGIRGADATERTAGSGHNVEGVAHGAPDPDIRNNGNDGDNNIGLLAGDENTDAEIYDRGGLKVSAGVACLWHWLNQRDLAGFNCYRSMTNATRRDMIENNMTEVERVFWNVVRMPPYEVMTLTEIQDYIMSGGGVSEDFPASKGDDILFGFSGKEKGQIRRLVQQHLQKQEQVKVTLTGSQNGDSQVTTEGGQVTTFWVRGWSFKRGQKFSKKEIRKMYENRLK